MSRRSNRQMRSKYAPHQGKKECQRRLDQIQMGKLRGNEKFIPTSVRFAAAGLYYGGLGG